MNLKLRVIAGLFVTAALLFLPSAASATTFAPAPGGPIVVGPPDDSVRTFATGDVDGDTITWKQSMTVPMPMTLDCKATVEDDVLKGSVAAGAFGSFPLNGTRTA